MGNSEKTIEPANELVVAPSPSVTTTKAEVQPENNAPTTDDAITSDDFQTRASVLEKSWTPKKAMQRKISIFGNAFSGLTQLELNGKTPATIAEKLFAQ